MRSSAISGNGNRVLLSPLAQEILNLLCRCGILRSRRRKTRSSPLVFAASSTLAKALPHLCRSLLGEFLGIIFQVLPGVHEGLPMDRRLQCMNIIAVHLAVMKYITAGPASSV